jgi:hypothetical protein
MNDRKEVPQKVVTQVERDYKLALLWKKKNQYHENQKS